MGNLVRALKFLLAIFLLSAVVLWFESRRGDRGYIEEVVTIDRPAATVYRWISSDDLLRRWISNLIKLERTAPGGGQPGGFHLEETVSDHAVAMDILVLRSIANQELDLSVRSAAGSKNAFIGTASFRLFAAGEYTKLEFTSRTDFLTTGDAIFEPILTHEMKDKVYEDLTRLKLMMEAEPYKPEK